MVYLFTPACIKILGKYKNVERAKCRKISSFINLVLTVFSRSVRTNLPKEIMNFPDYREIKGGNRSCVSHDVIRDYLEDYAVHFDLKQHIRVSL